MLARLWSVGLILFVGVLPVVPPEHVHEIADHGHAELLVHRHTRMHTPAPSHEGHAASRGVDHPDAPVTTLDSSFVVPAVARVVPPAEMVRLAPLQPVLPRQPRVASFVERLIHGPPRAPAPQRGPPFFLTS